MNSQELTFQIKMSAQFIDAIATKVSKDIMKNGNKPLLDAIATKVSENVKTENLELDYTVKEIAKLTNQSEETTRRHIKSNLLIAHKVGKYWKVTETNLKLYLNGK